MIDRNDDNPTSRGGPARPCPICGKPSVAAHKPFCSQRCADVDLHHWLSGSYTIPVREDEEEDELRALGDEASDLDEEASEESGRTGPGADPDAVDRRPGGRRTLGRRPSPTDKRTRH